MKLNVTLTVGRSRQHVVRSTMVAVLTMAALLLGLLGLHSAALGDETNATSSAASAPGDPAAAERGTANATTVSSYVDSGSRTASDGFLLGCVILGMACVALLVLASIVMLAQRPAVYRRLLDAGGVVVDSFTEIPFHLHRPSLTLLSISRV